MLTRNPNTSTEGAGTTCELPDCSQHLEAPVSSSTILTRLIGSVSQGCEDQWQDIQQMSDHAQGIVIKVSPLLLPAPLRGCVLEPTLSLTEESYPVAQNGYLSKLKGHFWNSRS